MVFWVSTISIWSHSYFEGEETTEENQLGEGTNQPKKTQREKNIWKSIFFLFGGDKNLLREGHYQSNLRVVLLT